VRERHIGYSGNHTTPYAAARGAAMGFSAQAMDDIAQSLFPALAQRAAALSLDDTPSEAMVQQSLDKALTAFTQNARPAGGVDDALDAIAASADGYLPEGVRAVLYAPATSDAPSGTATWTLHRFDRGPAADTPRGAHAVLPPRDALQTLLTATDAAEAYLAGLPWLAQRFERPDGLRVLPLGRAVHAWLICPAAEDAASSTGGPAALAALAGVWGHALAAAEAHDAAQSMSEDLARTGDALARAQSEAAQQESLIRPQPATEPAAATR